MLDKGEKAPHSLERQGRKELLGESLLLGGGADTIFLREKFKFSLIFGQAKPLLKVAATGDFRKI